MQLLKLLFMSCITLLGCRQSAREPSQSINLATISRVELEQLVRTFLESASREDTAGVITNAADEVAIRTVMGMVANEPAVVRAALSGMALRAASPQGEDTVGAVFSFPYRQSREDMGVTVVRRDGRWRVARVTLPRRV